MFYPNNDIYSKYVFRGTEQLHNIIYMLLSHLTDYLAYSPYYD